MYDDFEKGRLFQLTAARRRLVSSLGGLAGDVVISTHSRAKAAGRRSKHTCIHYQISTHSRAKAAGIKLIAL